ncbi:hypothetical protein TNCV_4963591 [Trichonephila clavipes]|nr:hypothetical protein TNCV_4963591 [Trichonephila clavipes]
MQHNIRIRASNVLKTCGSPVVNVSDHGRHVMSSSPGPLKTRRVGQRCPLNLSRAETSSRCYARAFGDDPRNFEQWSSDVDVT